MIEYCPIVWGWLRIIILPLHPSNFLRARARPGYLQVLLNELALIEKFAGARNVQLYNIVLIGRANYFLQHSKSFSVFIIPQQDTNSRNAGD